jgi:putative aldouronate transport system permease protein
LKKKSRGRILFEVFNYTFLITLAVVCILPILHVTAVSFSNKAPAVAGFVKFWPVGFTLKTYEYVFGRQQFLTALWVSVRRVLAGLPVNMLLAVLTAYPLSKTKGEFRARSFFSWFFIVTMYINGGLIPTFMVVRYTGLIDSFWALVIPNALNIFNMLIVMNYMRNSIPREIEESAIVDGAGYWRTLGQIVVPLSMPVLATVGLFFTIYHWNAWFDGILYMNKTENYPLQSYLRSIVMEIDSSMMETVDDSLFEALSDKTSKCAQIVMSIIPIMLVYPFAQRYFISGITLGSVKE